MKQYYYLNINTTISNLKRGDIYAKIIIKYKIFKYEMQLNTKRYNAKDTFNTTLLNAKHKYESN